MTYLDLSRVITLCLLVAVQPCVELIPIEKILQDLLCNKHDAYGPTSTPTWKTENMMPK